MARQKIDKTGRRIAIFRQGPQGEKPMKNAGWAAMARLLAVAGHIYAIDVWPETGPPEPISNRIKRFTKD